MYRYPIELVTMRDVRDFVLAVKDAPAPVTLTDGKNFRVSAHSLLGAVAAMEWSELYAECDMDIRRMVEDFCKP